MSEIDWSAVHHAHGPATDVPELVTLLCDDDPERRQDALYELNGNIWHEGTVYEATSLAVPGLVEVAVAAGLPDRAAVLDLLRRIYQGQSYAAQHAHLEPEERRRSPEFLAQMARELGWAAAARNAVEWERERLLALLDDDDASVRSAAVSLQCALGGPDAAGRLEERLFVEEDPAVRSHLVTGLAVVEPATPRERLERHLADPSWLVRREAAVNLCYLLREGTPSAVLDVLVACARRAPELEEAYARSPFRKGSFIEDTLAELEGAASGRPGVAGTLVDAVGGAEPAVAVELLASALRLAEAAGDLGAYRRAVSAWLDAEEAWSRPGVREVLSRLDLPAEEQALRAALDEETLEGVEAFARRAWEASSAGVLSRTLVVGEREATVETFWRELARPEHEGAAVADFARALVGTHGAAGAMGLAWHGAQIHPIGPLVGDNARAVLREAVAADPAEAARVIGARAHELLTYGAPRASSLLGHVLSGMLDLVDAGHAPRGPELEGLAAQCRLHGVAPDLVARVEGEGA